MGGINHQPTGNVSLELTVPAAEALSQAQKEFWAGNVDIEQVVKLTGKTVFGAGHAHLAMANGHFGGSIEQLRVVKAYVGKVIDTISNPDYEPFDLAAIGDIGQYVSTLTTAGLLPEGMAAHMATSVTEREGYRGMFFEIDTRIDAAIAKLQKLVDTTAPMVDGPEGKQGYFWSNVEAGLNSWRQDFLCAMTALMDLTTFWATTSTICTQAHLVGAFNKSMLEHVQIG